MVSSGGYWDEACTFASRYPGRVKSQESVPYTGRSGTTGQVSVRRGFGTRRNLHGTAGRHCQRLQH